MSDLRELLALRTKQSDAEVLKALRDGLAADPAASGAAAGLHALLQGYFELDEAAITSNFGPAFRRYPEVARELLAMLAEDGEHQAAALMRSIVDGRPRPTGALAAGLGAGAAEAARHSPGVQAAFDAFSKTALASNNSSAEIELSLAWSAVEAGLLERVEQHAAMLAFSHGSAHRQEQARRESVDDLVARKDIATLLAEMAAAPRPRVLARPSEWAIANEKAPAELVEVPVRHRLAHAPLGPALRLGNGAAVQQLLQLYRAANGAELFEPVAHEPHEPGLSLIADSEWDNERERMMVWLTMGIDPSELPEWAHTLVPIAALTGDASRWVVPTEGPYAGAVMLSNDDVHDEHVRFPSVAHFVAALRSAPQQVLANGGYVSYVAPEHEHLLYPEAYVEGDGGGASAA